MVVTHYCGRYFHFNNLLNTKEICECVSLIKSQIMTCSSSISPLASAEPIIFAIRSAFSSIKSLILILLVILYIIVLCQVVPTAHIINLHRMRDSGEIIPLLKLQRGTPIPVGTHLKTPWIEKTPGTQALTLANVKNEDHCSLFNGRVPVKSLLSPQVVPAVLCNLSTSSDPLEKQCGPVQFGQ